MKIYKPSILPWKKERLREIYRFFTEIEAKLDRDMKELEEEFETECRELEKGEHPELTDTPDVFDQYADESYEVSQIFRQQLRRSLVVTLHSFAESFLFDACSQIQQERKLKVTLNDLKGDGVPKYKSYLEKVCEIDAKWDARSWQELHKLTIVRNLIVHAEGYATKAKSPKKVKGVIDNSPGLSFTNGVLQINDSYLQAMLEQAEAVIDEVIEKVSKTRSPN